MYVGRPNKSVSNATKLLDKTSVWQIAIKRLNAKR